MAGDPHPVAEITGITTTDDVSKSAFIGFVKARTILVVEDAAEVNATDLSGQLLISVQEVGRVYRLDTADVSTADDGIFCIRDANGLAFLLEIDGLILQRSFSTNTTTTIDDAGKHLLHPSADTTARTATIDSNANVPYPKGTAISFVNQNGAGTLTIAIASDTMRLAGNGATGNRTLLANGMATALKLTATEWMISGIGLS